MSANIAGGRIRTHRRPAGAARRRESALQTRAVDTVLIFGPNDRFRQHSFAADKASLLALDAELTTIFQHPTPEESLPAPDTDNALYVLALDRTSDDFVLATVNEQQLVEGLVLLTTVQTDNELAPNAAHMVLRAMVGRTVGDVERGLILETLRYCAGNRTQAARILGISLRTIRNKLRSYAYVDADATR